MWEDTRLQRELPEGIFAHSDHVFRYKWSSMFIKIYLLQVDATNNDNYIEVGDREEGSHEASEMEIYIVVEAACGRRRME